MRRYLSLLFIGIATLTGVSSAFAAAGVLIPTITTIPTSPARVTFSGADGLTIYWAVSYKFKNDGGNAFTKVTATFDTSVVTTQDPATGNPYGYTAPLYLDGNALPQGCEKKSETKFSCFKSKLEAGESFPASGSFTVFYKSPTKSSSDTAPDGYYSLKVTSSFVYGEGTSGNNPVGQPSTLGCADDSSICPTVELGTDNLATLVVSAVPKPGVTLYTGNDGVPGAYPFAAKVVIPPVNQVFELPAKVFLSVPVSPSPTVCISSGQLLTCRAAEITIKELNTTTSSEALSVTLRFAAFEVVGKPVRPELINVVYFKNEFESLGNVNQPGTECVGYGTANPVPRADERPCVANRKYYKNKGVSGYTDALAGVVELMFLVVQNGNWTSF